MGSKKMRKTLLGLLLVFILLVAVLALTNLDKVKQKLGLESADAMAEMGTTEEDNANGGQIGQNLSAFLQDETFFDPEVQFKSIESYSGKSVSMVMSSVSKDLRIMIVDSLGELVTGAPFTVTLQGMGSYTDEDEDGIIYIDKLRAGEYSVSLEELEGYRVPNTIMTIQVRDKIEYRVLDDIEYLILTEADINAKQEDTAVNGAAEEADGTENTDLEFSRGNGKLGIDVSKWNEWETV